MPVEMDPSDMSEADADTASLAKETEKARSKRVVTAYKETLSSADGRCVLYSILDNAGMFGAVWKGEGQATIAFVGAHDIASGLWATLIAISPALVATMIKENAR